MRAGASDNMDVGASANTVRFTLPSLPGSLNEIYELNRHDSGLPRKRLKGEWSLWCSRMAPFIPPFTIADTSVLRVDRLYAVSWFYGNGRWRKLDVVNMDALLFNLVTRKIGVDDSKIKCGMMNSIDSKDNRVEVVLTEVTEAEWKSQI